MDISKCRAGSCPLRFNCIRYTSPENPLYQSWIESEYDEDVNQCSNFDPEHLNE